MTIIEKVILTTEEAAEYCGGPVNFEELEALYGATLLKPWRTLGNNKRSWSRLVVLGVVNKAQSEGLLNDRELVQKAVEKLRHNRKLLKSQAGD